MSQEPRPNVPTPQTIADPPAIAEQPEPPETGAEASTPQAPRRKHLYAYRIAFLVVLVAAWWAFAEFYLEIMPNPWETFAELGSILIEPFFYQQLGITTTRVIGGFGAAFLFGLIVGGLMGLSRRIEAFMEVAIITGVAAPGLFVAMIILVAFGINNRAAVMAIAVIAAPAITVTFWQATKNLDHDLDQMAKVFGYTTRQRVRHIILPQLIAPALAATRYGLGFAWKLVVVVELIGLSNGVGFQVSFFFQLFNLRGVIAWTLGFMLFILVLEYVLLRPLEQRVSYWRDNPARPENRKGVRA